jgi:hypothetical protein
MDKIKSNKIRNMETTIEIFPFYVSSQTKMPEYTVF